MSTKRQRRSDRAGRGVLRSPGRPSVAQRDERRRFWVAIAGGRSSEDSAVAVGISPAVGVRWFRETGGMPPTHLAPSSVPLSGRYLSIAEREELAMLRVQAHGVREIARRMARAPSTISRELRRNAATRSGDCVYRATTAQWHADRAQSPRCPDTCDTRSRGTVVTTIESGPHAAGAWRVALQAAGAIANISRTGYCGTLPWWRVSSRRWSRNSSRSTTGRHTGSSGRRRLH